MIIAGDSNIDLCSSSNIGEKYQAVLHAFISPSMSQHQLVKEIKMSH